MYYKIGFPSLTAPSQSKLDFRYITIFPTKQRARIKKKIIAIHLYRGTLLFYEKVERIETAELTDFSVLVTEDCRSPIAILSTLSI